MPKFQIRQINLTDDEYDVVRAADDRTKIPKYVAMLHSQLGEPELGLVGKFYETVAEIEARDLNHVFEIGNMGPEEAITRLGRMHSVSVGDMIVDPEGRYHLVASFGFEAQP